MPDSTHLAVSRQLGILQKEFSERTRTIRWIAAAISKDSVETLFNPRLANPRMPISSQLPMIGRYRGALVTLRACYLPSKSFPNRQNVPSILNFVAQRCWQIFFHDGQAVPKRSSCYLCCRGRSAANIRTIAYRTQQEARPAAQIVCDGTTPFRYLGVAAA